MRNKNRNLFDLLLDEAAPWESLDEEHKNLALRILLKPFSAIRKGERTMNDASKVLAQSVWQTFAVPKTSVFQRALEEGCRSQRRLPISVLPSTTKREINPVRLPRGGG